MLPWRKKPSHFNEYEKLASTQHEYDFFLGYFTQNVFGTTPQIIWITVKQRFSQEKTPKNHKYEENCIKQICSHVSTLFPSW